MESIVIGEYNEIPIDLLVLDDENPRLSPNMKDKSQLELAVELERRYNLTSLIDSIVNFGFFKAEPLVGVKEYDKIKIVEGNRRLAVIRFLTDKNYRNHSKDPKLWDEKREILQRNKHNLEKIPVMVYEDKRQVIAYLGYKHITRTLEWEPLAKARFVDKNVELYNIKSFKEIAKIMNSRSDTVRNNYVAYRVYKQAKDEFNIDVKKVEERFGVFYTALNNGDIRNYIDLKRNMSIEELKNPISKLKEEELHVFIDLLHGTGKKGPAIKDSRRIKDLGIVLNNKNAREELIKSRNIDSALRYIKSDIKRLEANLDLSIEYLKEAIKSINRYKDNSVIKLKVRKLIEIVVKLKNSVIDDL